MANWLVHPTEIYLRVCLTYSGLAEGLSSKDETTYSEEEKIFQINNETKKLIEGLELNNDEKNKTQ